MTSTQLSANQLSQYQEQGFVIPDYRVSTPLLADIRLAHGRLVQRHPEFNDYCAALLAYDLWFLNVAREPDILDLVCQVLGTDIALWNCSLFAKPPQIGSATPWHQDGEYWPITPLATCTVWIALDDSTTHNGCLRVIPGSHQERRVANHAVNDAPGLALNRELSADQFDESQAVDIELEAGQISLHDVYLYHGSEANLSNHARRGMTLRYMPTTSVYQHEHDDPHRKQGRLDMAQRTLFLMRGIDRAGSNDFCMRY
ncbi:MAG: phytanoyl-CoA dioxygenase family protein [Planctomycetota bacterium]|nr:phytanoyl-CoA dioxygenase family protein [Planctomycetota bacterium]